MHAALLLTVFVLAAEDLPPADVPAAKGQEKQRQLDVAVLAPAKAKLLLVRAGAELVKAELHPEPLLRWSNPTAGSVYGEVFVWSVDGRPAVLASIYRWYHPYHDATVEFASVWEGPAEASEGEVSHWTTPTAGVSFADLPQAPVPAAGRGLRLVQMRDQARRFAAELADERGGDQVERQLRLLNQPVHRYASPKHQILDGAIFAFVEGTDPEAWLLIEAVEEKGTSRLRFALVRMNVDAIQIRLDREVIRIWPNIRDAWKDRQAPYTLFSFDPGTVSTAPHASPPK